MFLAVALLTISPFGLSPLDARAQVYFAGAPPVTLGSGFKYPYGVAVDAAGDAASHLSTSLYLPTTGGGPCL